MTPQSSSPARPGSSAARSCARSLADGVAVRAATRTPANARLPARRRSRRLGRRADPERAHSPAATRVVHLAGEPVFGGLPTKTPPRAHPRQPRRLDARAGAVDRAASRGRAAEGVRVRVGGRLLRRARRRDARPSRRRPGAASSPTCASRGKKKRAPRPRSACARVSLRIGIVLAREGGALATLARLFRLGLGGVVGSGRQWVPWIHVDDLVAMIRAALRDERWSGVANAVAPAPVTNAELTRALARAVRRPALLPAPAFAVRVALGETGGRAARQPPRGPGARPRGRLRVRPPRAGAGPRGGAPGLAPGRSGARRDRV